MTTDAVAAAPDLIGLDGLPEGVRTIWRPAHPSNYWTAVSRPYAGVMRRFVAICYHTPEEAWDDNETTPAWFADPRANASTNYYADSDGDLYQMVRDQDFAWAQGVRRAERIEPRPSWWRDAYISYNTCMISIEIEGYARDIGRTFVAGSRQFEAVAAWSAYVCEKYGIPIEARIMSGIASCRGTSPIRVRISPGLSCSDGCASYRSTWRIECVVLSVGSRLWSATRTARQSFPRHRSSRDPRFPSWGRGRDCFPPGRNHCSSFPRFPLWGKLSRSD